PGRAPLVERRHRRRAQLLADMSRDDAAVVRELRREVDRLEDEAGGLRGAPPAGGQDGRRAGLELLALLIRRPLQLPRRRGDVGLCVHPSTVATPSTISAAASAGVMSPSRMGTYGTRKPRARSESARSHLQSPFGHRTYQKPSSSSCWIRNSM